MMWSTEKFWRLLDAATHLRRHRRVTAAVAATPFAGIRTRQPRLAVKYLNPLHLAAGLSSSARAAAMVHHYDMLRTRVHPAMLTTILGDGATIWTHEDSATRHAVILCFSHPTDNEGELTLEYRVDGVTLHVLSFTFVPGCVVGADTAVLLVSRLQGTRNRFDEIRAAMKALDGLAAPALLVAAVQGIALGLGTAQLAAVAAARQVGQAPDMTGLLDSYDRFFAKLGGVPGDGFFHLPLPLAERPIAAIAGRNRARVRAQRAIKHDVARAAQRSVDGSATTTTAPGPTHRAAAA